MDHIRPTWIRIEGRRHGKSTVQTHIDTHRDLFPQQHKWKPICNISTFGIRVSNISFTEGRGRYRLIQCMGYIQIIRMKPSNLLKYKTCGHTYRNSIISYQAPDKSTLSQVYVNKYVNGLPQNIPLLARINVECGVRAKS